VPSSEAETIRRESGDQAQLATERSWPDRVARHNPEAESQMRSVLSPEAETRRLCRSILNRQGTALSPKSAPVRNSWLFRRLPECGAPAGLEGGLARATGQLRERQHSAAFDCEVRQEERCPARLRCLRPARAAKPSPTSSTNSMPWNTDRIYDGPPTVSLLDRVYVYDWRALRCRQVLVSIRMDGMDIVYRG
jgi:hypothetical protein